MFFVIILKSFQFHVDSPSHVQKGNCLLRLLDNVADFNQNNNKLLIEEIKMIKLPEQGAEITAKNNEMGRWRKKLY